jgi:hypothetical protein
MFVGVPAEEGVLGGVVVGSGVPPPVRGIPGSGLRGLGAGEGIGTTHAVKLMLNVIPTDFCNKKVTKYAIIEA